MTDCTNYDSDGGTDALGLGGGGGSRTKAGILILTSNPSIGKNGDVSFYLRKTNSAAGTINLAVYDNADNSLIGTGGTLDVDNITGTTTAYTFSLPSGYTITENHQILLEGGTVSDTNEVELQCSNTGSYSSSYYQKALSNHTSSLKNMWWCFSEGSTGSLLPPPIAMVRL